MEEKREKTVDINTPEAAIESDSEVALHPAQQEELYVSEAATPDAPQMIETDLVLPPTERTKAPRPEELNESVYVAAESAAGLPVVGGLKGWFAEDGHWGPSKNFAGFAAETKVTDPAQLEICVRRAILEALAVRNAGVEGLLVESWRADGGWDRALGLGVKVAADGKATLEGDAVAVVEGLGGDEGVREEMMPAEQAKEIVQMTSREWKQVSLKDARLKFAVSHALFQSMGSTVMGKTETNSAAMYRSPSASSNSRVSKFPTPNCSTFRPRADSSRRSSSQSRHARSTKRSSSAAN